MRPFCLPARRPAFRPVADAQGANGDGLPPLDYAPGLCPGGPA